MNKIDDSERSVGTYLIESAPSIGELALEQWWWGVIVRHRELLRVNHTKSDKCDPPISIAANYIPPHMALKGPLGKEAYVCEHVSFQMS